MPVPSPTRPPRSLVAASIHDEEESTDARRGRRAGVGRGQAPGGRLTPLRSRPRPRRRTIAGLLTCLSVGLIVLLVVSLSPQAWRLSPGTGSAPSVGSTGNLPASAGTTLVPQTSVGQVPTALDAEWADYSDHSTCANWAGGDGISAVRLSASQIAWFFSDSYLGPAGPSAGFSRSTGLIHNSVVIQTLSGQGSGFVTLTGGGVCSSTQRPAAVVAPPQAPGGHGVRYWSEDGIAIGGTVLKFYNSYRPGNAPYMPTGTVLAAFSVAQLSSAGSGSAGGSAAAPQLIPLPSYTPAGSDSPIAWGAAVLRTGNTVYIYGTQTPDAPVPDRQLYVARVPASRLTQFAAWQFYAGSGRWTASQSAAQPVQPPASSLSVSSGFSVVRVGSRYWLIQADPIAGTQDIDAYPGDTPWGPFDQAAGIVLYRDPGIGADAAHDYRIMYEARVVPALSAGNALVITYNPNSIGITTGCIPMSWFTNTVTMPRFVSVPLTMFNGLGDRRDDTVLTGPANYPQVASGDPGQWSNVWNYSNGCPPVPGVTSVQARPRAGAVILSWPDAGLGVAYRVYIHRPGAAGYQLSTTVSFVLSTTARLITVTLTGLPPGRYTGRVVPVNLRLHTGRAGQVDFTVPAG